MLLGWMDGLSVAGFIRRLYPWGGWVLLEVMGLICMVTFN